ncbi:hypothetical protein ACFXG9_32110 [Streptomyces mirabilis]|uniref:hypothetical protein n=1 Tax=Streptomyces mirabilis TaxID=68239 RepID=UPI0036AC7209
MGQGDFEEAYQQAAFIAPTGTLPKFAPHARWTVLDLVDAAVRTGRQEQARDHVTAARTAALDDVSPRLSMVLHAFAALAADDDRHPGFDDALAVEGAERWPFDLARIHLYYGERLRRGRAPRTRAPAPGVRGGDLPTARCRPLGRPREPGTACLRRPGRTATLPKPQP